MLWVQTSYAYGTARLHITESNNVLDTVRYESISIKGTDEPKPPPKAKSSDGPTSSPSIAPSATAYDAIPSDDGPVADGDDGNKKGD